jgi:HK97 gp10 family phage protein
MAFAVVTGVQELDRTLRELGEKVASRASRRAVQFTGQVIAVDAKAAAPKGKTGNLRKQIRYKWDKQGRNIVNGKVTVGSRHGHLVTMGTKERFHKKTGKHVGRVVGSHFFKFVVGANGERYARILRERLKLYIDHEVARVSRKAG